MRSWCWSNALLIVLLAGTAARAQELVPSRSFQWPTSPVRVTVKNCELACQWREGQPWALQEEVAKILKLPLTGEREVNLATVLAQGDYQIRVARDGTHEVKDPHSPANFVRVPSRGGSGPTWIRSWDDVSHSPSQRRRSPNATQYKSQRDEFFATHKLGRIFDLRTERYLSGQENRVYVNPYTRSDGTHVQRHTRSFPQR